MVDISRKLPLEELREQRFLVAALDERIPEIAPDPRHRSELIEHAAELLAVGDELVFLLRELEDGTRILACKL